MNQDPIVALRDVEKEYSLGKTTVHAVRGVSFEIQSGEFTAIAGPSGSGKSTLLNLIGCMDTATRGEVVVAQQATRGLRDARLTDLRLNTLGFIFQSFNLIDVLNVFQNVEFPLLLKGGFTRTQRKERVESLLEKVGLQDHLKHKPGELSGGQRQRVAIARALVTQPKLVLADEPTANLDSETGNDIIALMRQINERDHTTFVFSTHDSQIMDQARRRIRIVDGLLQSDERSTP